MTLEEYMRELVLMSRQYGQEEELYPLINMLLRENNNVRDLSVRDVHNKGSKGARKKIFSGFGSYPDLAIVSEDLYLDLTHKEIKKEEIGKIYGCVEAKIYNGKDKIIPLKEIIDKKICLKWWTLDISDKAYLLKKNEKKRRSYEVEVSDGKELLDNNLFDKRVKEDKFIEIKSKVKIDNINWDEYYKDIELERNIKAIIGGTNIIHNDLNQLITELFWFRKVLYTDGLVWYYLELKKPCKDKMLESLGMNIGKGFSSKCANDMINIRTIQVLGIEIGNLKEIYGKVFKNTEKEERISVSAVGQHLTDEDRKKWKRLKDHLARINWCGTNTLNQFRLKTEN